jgi:hypothetical protein
MKNGEQSPLIMKGVFDAPEEQTLHIRRDEERFDG